MKLLALTVAAALLAGFQDPPPPPSGVVATAGPNQIMISWTNYTPAPAGYNVWRSPFSGGPYTKVNPELLGGSPFLNTSLPAGTPFFYIVRAQNSQGIEGANSSEVTAIPDGTDTTPPPQPVITSASRKTRDTTPSTSGIAEPGSTVYLFAGATGIGTAAAAQNGTWTVANPDALGSDGVYALTALASDLTGNQSAASAAIQITLDTTAPDAPTNVRVLKTPTFIDVEWTASVSSDVAGHKVFRQTNGGSWVLLNTTGLVTITKYRDSSVSGGNTYRYRVTAVDNALAD